MQIERNELEDWCDDCYIDYSSCKNVDSALVSIGMTGGKGNGLFCPLWRPKGVNHGIHAHREPVF